MGARRGAWTARGTAPPAVSIPLAPGSTMGAMSRNESDDLDTLSDPYGKPAYPGRGQAGDEVADALTADLVEEYASDDPAAAFAPHREGYREGIVGRLVEDDDALDSEHDDVTAHDSGEDDDLSAEESALHYIDPDNDPIPE